MCEPSIEAFKRELEALIRTYEPLEKRWMSFQDLISMYRNKECSVTSIPSNISGFMFALQKAVRGCTLSYDLKKDLFEAAMVDHAQGPYIRITMDRRIFPRAIQRPECKAFHKAIKKKMKWMDIDKGGPSDRTNPPRPSPDKTKKRPKDYRMYVREECQKFHDKHGDIYPSIFERKGPGDRQFKGNSLIDLSKLLGR
jgi:hypothetical protein